MSEETNIPVWGDKLARRITALEKQWEALQPSPPPTSPAADPLASTSIAADTANVLDAPPPAPDNAELERRRQALEEADHELQSVQTRLANARQQAEAADALAAANQRRAAALAAREAAIQAAADQIDRTRRVIERIWPRFMLTPDFAEWRAGIEGSLLTEAPSPSAALLFANLHGYTACLLENDQKYLRDGLRDISRFLYAWLKETGHNEREAFEIALAWAAAFNEECAGKCEIEVPEPGTPANALSMTFPPRGSSPEVVSVRTWAVRDAGRRIIHRAEVFT